MTEEMIPIVNEKDEVIDEKPFNEVHKKGLLHRESYVYLINSKKEVLLQKRPDRNVWDHSAAGHFSKDETYEEGALREFEEELGISIKKEDLKEIGYERFSSIRPGNHNERFAKIYFVKKDIPLTQFNIDEWELSDVKYFGKKELLALLKNQDLVAHSASIVMEKYILKLLN